MGNIGIYIAIAIVIVILIYTLVTYNNFVKLRNIVEESFSTMDVYLKKRWDLIPNLVATVKGYAKHEQQTLKEVIGLRSGAYDSMSTEEKIDVNNKISQGVTKIMALAEAYPDLKANTNFQQLSADLSATEKDIANSRKYYNGSVRAMNDKVQMFPSNIIAKIFGFKTYKMFEINSSERENVKVEF